MPTSAWCASWSPVGSGEWATACQLLHRASCNQLERFFVSVKELVAKIDHFVAHHNENGKPSRRAATADTILAWGGPIW